jgi:hypothetical protein
MYLVAGVRFLGSIRSGLKGEHLRR